MSSKPAHQLVNDLKKTANDIGKGKVGKAAADLIKTAKDANEMRRPHYNQAQSLRRQIESFDKKSLKKTTKHVKPKQKRSGEAYGNAADKVFHRRDFIMDIQGNNNTLPSISSIPISANSPQTFPWLSSIADNFEIYHIKSLKFIFEGLASNVVSTGVLGQVVMAIDYNPTEPPPSTIAQVCNKYKERVRNPTHTFSVSYGNTTKLIPIPTKFVEHDNQNAALNAFGSLIIAVYGTQLGPIGKLYAQYTVALRMPQLPNSNHMQIYSGSKGGITIPASTNIPIFGNYLTLGVAPQSTFNGPSYVGPFMTSLGETTGNSGVSLWFNQPGLYRVSGWQQVTVTSGTIDAVNSHQASQVNAIQYAGTQLGDTTSLTPYFTSAANGSFMTYVTDYVDAWSTYQYSFSPTNGSSLPTPASLIGWTNLATWNCFSTAGCTVLSTWLFTVIRINTLAYVNVQENVEAKPPMLDPKYMGFLLKHKVEGSTDKLKIVKDYFDNLSLFEKPDEIELLQLLADKKDTLTLVDACSCGKITCKQCLQKFSDSCEQLKIK